MLLCVLSLLLAGPTGPVAAAPPPVTAVAYRPDGKLLAAGTRGAVALIDPVIGEVVAALPGQTGRVTTVAFDRDGRLAVASGEPGRAGELHLYDTRDPKRPAVAKWTAHKDTVYALAFSPDGKTLATAGYDRVIKLWDVPPSANPVPRLTLTDHSDAVYGLAFSPDGRLLASASADRTVKVWEPATGKRLFTLSDPTDWVYAVAWHPDGQHLFAAGADKSVRLWAITPAGGSLLKSSFAHEKAVSRLLLATGGKTLFSVGDDRVVKAWEPLTLAERKAYPPRQSDVFAAAVRPDGRQLAVGQYDGTLQLLDPTSGKPTAAPLPVKPKPAVIAALDPNSGVRGGKARVRVTGSRLDQVMSVTVAASGVTAVIRPEGRTADAMTVELTIPPTTAPGPVMLTLTAPAGGSKPVLFWIDRFPSVRETGATDSAHDAMTISLPATVAGAIDRPGDVDFYRFHATAGQRIGVQVQVADGKAFDPVLVLTDAAGQVLANGGDHLGYVAPAAGVYAVGVRDREYRGGPASVYRLHVGPIPVVTGVFPLGVAPKIATPVRVNGVNLPAVTDKPIQVTPEAGAGSTVEVPMPRGGGDPVGRAVVTVGEFPSVIVGPGGTADLPAVPGTADGLLAAAGESHTIRFPAKKDQPLVVEVHAARLGSPVDSVIELLDTAGRPVPRAALQCTAKTTVTFRDHDSDKPGIRLDTWNELRTDDFLYIDGELTRIKELPRGPDDDCQFYQLDGKRVGFLGTTPTHHPFGAPAYRVAVLPPDAAPPANGLPVFRLYHRNDDGGQGYGKDSRLFFDPPADGVYQVRVADAAGGFGPAHAYRLTVRPPKPDFTVKVTPNAPKVWAGGGVPVTVTATRTDGFDGPIRIRFVGVNTPFFAPDTVIEAGQTSTVATLGATPDVPKAVAGRRFDASLNTGNTRDSDLLHPPRPSLRVVGEATLGKTGVVRDAGEFTPIVVPAGDLAATTSVSELVIRPGGEARMVVKVDRRNGFTGRVPIDVRGLPHGVRVQNVGLNGILATPNVSEREVVIAAEPWVKPTAVPFVVLVRNEQKGTEHTAPSVMLRVQE